MLTRALVPAVVLALAAAGAGRPATVAASGSCRVTLPNHTVVDGAGFGRDAFNYGNAHLRAHLNWPRGVLGAGIRPDGGATAIVNPDGSIYAKLGWWRGVRGRFAVRGRRLDAPAPPLRVDISPASYGAVGFIPSGLTFPTVGCWQVTGTIGRAARLTFVVRVVKLRTS